jgi:hypothetical protein
MAAATLFALALPFLAVAFAGGSSATDPASTNDLWINGRIFVEDGVLMFRADKPVRGNPRKDVVVLGVSMDARGLLPIYVHAATTSVRFRLFGILEPFAGTFRGHPAPLPNVQFITWKMHTPGDPDVTPADQRIDFKGRRATMNGKPVTLEDGKGKDIEAGTSLKIDHGTARGRKQTLRLPPDAASVRPGSRRSRG